MKTPSIKLLLALVLACIAHFQLSAQTVSASPEKFIKVGASSGLNNYRSRMELDGYSGGQAGGCNYYHSDFDHANRWYFAAYMEFGLSKHLSIVQEVGLYHSAREYQYAISCFYIFDSTYSYSLQSRHRAVSTNLRSQTFLRIFSNIKDDFRLGLETGLAFSTPTETFKRDVTSNLLLSDEDLSYAGLLGGAFATYQLKRHEFGVQYRANIVRSRPQDKHRNDYESFIAARNFGISYAFSLR